MSSGTPQGAGDDYIPLGGKASQKRKSRGGPGPATPPAAKRSLGQNAPHNKPVYRNNSGGGGGGKGKSKKVPAKGGGAKKGSGIQLSQFHQDLLQDRIRHYLEENANKTYIDVEQMSRHIHKTFPVYRRHNFVTFTQTIDRQFMIVQEKMDAELAAAQQAEAAAAADGGAVAPPDVVMLDEDDDDEGSAGKAAPDPTAVNRSVNSTMHNLYASLPAHVPASEGQDTVDVDDDAASVRSVPPDLTDYERIRQRTREYILRDKFGGNVGNIDNGTGDNSSKSNGAQQTSRKNDSETAANAGAEEPAPFRSTPSLLPTKAAMLLQQQQQEETNKPRPLPPSAPASRPNSRKTSRAASPSAAAAGSTSSKVAGGGGGALRARRSAWSEVACTVPNVGFSDVGGCAKTLAQVNKMTRCLRCPQVKRHFGVPSPAGCLIHGPPGSGKTLLANAIAGHWKLPMMTVTGTALVSGVSGDSEERIRDLFEKAKSNAPCILFLDNIDVIGKKRENAQKEMEVRIVTQLIACLDDLSASYSDAKEKDAGKVFVIGATNRYDSIDPWLVQALGRTLAMGIPDEPAREKILRILCRNISLPADFDFLALARLTPGYVGADLKSLVAAAGDSGEERYLQAMQNMFFDVAPPGTDFYEWLDSSQAATESLSGERLTFFDFESAVKVIRPTALLEGFATVPNVTFDDIGALDDVRERLEQAICVPVAHPAAARRLGLDTPSGVLLCGPPGCGKTLLAKAVANKAGINFISVKGPELINMYVGESERAIRQVFQRARNSAPCVIFFDEIDSICPRRSGSDSGGSSRVVNQMLIELDGFEERNGVYVMGATNRVDMVDPAVLRPGRLTDRIFVDVPSKEGRLDILIKMSSGRVNLDTDVDLSALSERHCDGFTGADLGKLIQKASEQRMREFCRDLQLGKVVSETDLVVSRRHFESALGLVGASVSGKERRRYDLMKRQFGAGAAEAASDGAAARKKDGDLGQDVVEIGHDGQQRAAPDENAAKVDPDNREDIQID